jgi:xylulokinase
MYLMGIDVGTSGCKAAVFDPNGAMTAYAYQEYSLIYPSAGAMELDPNEVWKAVCSCMERCGGQCDLSSVAAMSVSSQGEAVVPVGRNGSVLCNAPVTFDSRNEKEYTWFLDHFDRLEVLKTTGAPIHPMFSATKILWLKNNHPQIYESVWKFFCFSDFIAFRLGAEPCMDYSLASRTLLFDIRRKDWSREILEQCGIAKEKLPTAVPSGTRIGTVSKEISERFGFSPACEIISGGHDQLCCSLGAGVLHNGEIMDSLGTTESMVCVNEKLILTPEMAENNIPCSVYPVERLYAYMTFLTNSGSLLRWLKENFYLGYDENFYFHFDKHVENNYTSPSEVLVLPYFSGSGTPHLDFRSKGAIAGLTLDTNLYQIYQAMIEATCLEEKLNLANMESSGITVKELRCIGGGARSNIWLQIKANITGCAVLSMEINEAGCLGAAILAGLGSGIFRCASEAVESFVKVRRIYSPNPVMQEKYREKYQKYLAFYPSIRQMNL